MPKGVLSPDKIRLVLNPEQVAFMLEQIAEGKKYGGILQACQTFEQPFSPSAQHVQKYRNDKKEELAALRKQKEFAALTTGLAVKANRVEMLQDLAEMLYGDLKRRSDDDAEQSKLWLEDAKQVGTEQYDFLKFNSAEVNELRGVLDDIAKETGGRVSKVDITSDDKPLKGYVGVTPAAWKEKGKTDDKK